MTVYGLQWTQATDAYVRPAESVLTHKAVTSPTNAETLAAVAQASTYAPWSGMRRCNLWDDGTPTAYYGDRCYTDTDVANMGQCMVQIPKFWYCTDHGGGVYKWWVSDTGADAVPAGADGGVWKVHPAFLRDYPTNPAKSYIYLGAYEAYLNATKLESVAGVKPKDTYTLAQFRTAAHARAAGAVANKWEVQDYLTTSAVQLLYLIEYGNFSSQLLIGEGITNLAWDATADACNTGHTSALGNATGSVPFTAETQALTTNAVSYRGVENFYGNINQLVDGINIGPNTNYHLHIADHDFASNISGHPYVDSNIVLLASGGTFPIDISTTATIDYGFFPVTGGGANNTYLCDKYTSGTGSCLEASGGAWYKGTDAGMYYGDVSIAYNGANVQFGSRLMYIG
jgi:hypothetical protein